MPRPPTLLLHGSVSASHRHACACSFAFPLQTLPSSRLAYLERDPTCGGMSHTTLARPGTPSSTSAPPASPAINKGAHLLLQEDTGVSSMKLNFSGLRALVTGAGKGEWEWVGEGKGAAST